MTLAKLLQLDQVPHTKNSSVHRKLIIPYAAKDFPQPQVDDALGLLNENPPPMRALL